MQLAFSAVMGFIIGGLALLLLRLSGRFAPLEDPRTTLMRPGVPEALAAGVALAATLAIFTLLQPGAVRTRKGVALVAAPSWRCWGSSGSSAPWATATSRTSSRARP